MFTSFASGKVLAEDLAERFTSLSTPVSGGAVVDESCLQTNLNYKVKSADHVLFRNKVNIS